MNDGSFSLRYIGQEDHLVMPAVTTLSATQALYDMLFQYVLTPEKEAMLETFIGRVRVYLSENAFHQAPFSLPSEDLSFLEEGVEELKLLCWANAAVDVFEVVFEGEAGTAAGEKTRQEAETVLSRLFTFAWRGSNRILVYPPSLV